MKLSKKCQYALRAIFELSSKNSDKPLKARDIAKSQGISVRFIEIILNDLKHGGFVQSQRGSEGGYILAQDACKITPIDVIKHIDGPVSVGSGIDNGAFGRLWDDINKSIIQACSKTSFGQMVKYEMSLKEQTPPSYCI